MADLSITEADVQIGAGAKVITGPVAEAITIGAPIAINRGASNTLYLSSANDSVNTYRRYVNGLALSKGLGAGQIIAYQADQSINFGTAILEPGMIYVSSANQGKICPFTDLAIFSVVTDQIVSNVATFTTLLAHPFVAGQVLNIANAGSIYNSATSTVAASLSATTFSVNITHANDGPNTVTGSAQLKGVSINIIGIAQDTQNLKLLISGVSGNTGIVR